MSKMKYIFPVALLFSGTTQAATENSWYAGARLGGTHYSDFSNLPGDKDKDDWGGGVFLGYNLAPWFALETGYTYLGEASTDTASIEQQGIDLVGKYTWNTTESLDLFAKVGGFYYSTDGKDALSAADDNGITTTAGLGMEYFFTKNISTRLEYQYYRSLKLDDIEWDTHFYGVSLVYNWGGSETIKATDEPMVESKPTKEPEPMVESQPTQEPEPMTEPKIVSKVIEIAPLTIELPFVFDSDELPQEYLEKLAPIAQHLVDYPEAQLFIVGHTDSRGSETYNQSLSEQRAALVGNYLATKFAIDKSRITEIGRGELEPIASNDTAEGRALNRRVSVFTPGLKVQSK